MFRRPILLLPVLVAGCSAPTKPFDAILPVEVQGFTRGTVQSISPEEAPEIVRSLGLKRAGSAVYDGNGKIRARIFEMNVETSAFELIQKWRQQDGLAAYKGPYFVVVDPGGADQKTLAGFLQELRSKLP